MQYPKWVCLETVIVGKIDIGYCNTSRALIKLDESPYDISIYQSLNAGFLEALLEDISANINCRAQTAAFATNASGEPIRATIQLQTNQNNQSGQRNESRQGPYWWKCAILFCFKVE